MKTHYERSIEIEAPVSRVYACWERYQDFPAFTSALCEVEAVSKDRTRWRAHFFAGIDREWTAEIDERIPERRIAWHSRSGPPNAGCVTFHPRGAGRTRVMLQIDYLPDGWVAAAGDILRVPQRCIDAALEGFKAYVESVEQDRKPAPGPVRVAPRPVPAAAGAAAREWPVDMAPRPSLPRQAQCNASGRQGGRSRGLHGAAGASQPPFADENGAAPRLPIQEAHTGGNGRPPRADS